MKTMRLLFDRFTAVSCVFVGAAALSTGFAQQTIVTFPSPTEGGPAPDTANYSVGFEWFSANQLYWWSGFSQGGENPEYCEIGYNYTAPNSVTHLTVDDQNFLITGVGADWTYFYFADDRSKRIYHKVSWAGSSDSAYELPTPYTPPPAGYDLGAAMFWNGNFYWSDCNGSFFDIMSYNPQAGGAGYVRLGSGKKLVKMMGFTYNSSTFSYTDAIFALTADGHLLRMDINPQGPNNVLLATNVTDFAIRNESQTLPRGFAYFTTVYAATGQKSSLTAATPAGSLLAINAATGVSNKLYTASGQNQLTSVGLDSTNIYWTEQPITCNGPFGCLLGDYSIYRQSRPPDHTTGAGSIDLIGLPGGGAGVNLRSDGQWLYFLNNTAIKRISTGTPKVQLDVMADGLEVVQAIQNLDSQVPLVANRSTYVRGYAHVNSYTAKSWLSTAVLHGFRNGVEFADSPIFPLKTVTLLSGSISLPQLRADTQHTFLFQLPASWVQSGPDLPAQLTFSMTVNPDLEIPESSSQPFANNTVSLLQPATLQDGLVPSLITVPLVSKQGSIYYHYSPGFSHIFQRVLSLLPAEHLDVYSSLLTDPIGDWNNPFDFGNTNYNACGDAWGSALGAVEWLRLFCDPHISNDEHFVGMVHVNALLPGSSIGGISHRPGKTVLAAMAPGFGDGHSAYGGKIMAHELGHNYGRKHINCGTFPPDQMDFDAVTYPCSLGNPDTNLATATFGYDPIDNVAIAPNTASDLMTYSSPAWVSAYNWDSNLGLPPLVNAPPPPLGGPGGPRPRTDFVMAISAMLNPEISAAALDPFYIIPAASAPPAVLAESHLESDQAAAQPNPVYVVFLDSAGHFLSQVAVAAKDVDGNAINRLHIGQYVDFPIGARIIRLIQSGQILAERFVSPHAPMLTLNAPVIDSVAGALHLNWSASDSDGDPLLFTLQYSADNGATWRALRANYPFLEMSCATSMLPGGNQCLIRVIASDGANTAMAMTAPFSIPLQPPVPLIEGVNDGQQLNYGSPGSLIGLALDAQNSSASNQLQWVVSGPTPLVASNSSLSLERLSPGQYAATLTATDPGGRTGIIVRSFAVLPPAIPEGSASEFDGLGESSGYAGGIYIPLPLEDGSLASVRMFHAPGELYVSFSGLKFGHGSPRLVGLRIDPTANPGTTPGANDFGFFVDENGQALEAQGNGANLVTTLTPPPGFATAIYRSLNSWSAELKIPDSQLGGWGHLATVMLEHGPAQWPPTGVTNQPISWARVFLGTNPPAGPNHPPVANAGSSLTLSLSSSQTLALDGSASFDPDGDALTYAWTQTGGPSVSLSGANTAAPSFTVGPVATATTYTFQLVVNDGSINSAPGSVQVSLTPPLATSSVNEPSGGAFLRGDGTLELQLVGTPSQPYRIQASSNLVNWVNLNTIYADYAGRIVFESSDITNYPQRFYRAVR